MDSKGQLLDQNKVLAFFVDLSIFIAAIMSQGWIAFGGKPANPSIADQIFLWYPVAIVLLIEAIFIRFKKKTIGGIHVSRIKMSWFMAIVLIPLNSIIITLLGAWIIAMLSMILVGSLSFIGKAIGTL